MFSKKGLAVASYPYRCDYFFFNSFVLVFFSLELIFFLKYFSLSFARSLSKLVGSLFVLFLLFRSYSFFFNFNCVSVYLFFCHFYVNKALKWENRDQLVFMQLEHKKPTKRTVKIIIPSYIIIPSLQINMRNCVGHGASRKQVVIFIIGYFFLHHAVSRTTPFLKRYFRKSNL